MRILLSSFLAIATARSALSQGTDLGGGIVTRTDVEWLADLTLDVRDITDVIGSGGGTNAALEIYVDGKNAEPEIGNKRTLSQLSTDLAGAGVARATPQYLFHLYGMAERDKNRLSDNLSYADNYVRSAILAGRPSAGTAALVLNMWMRATHFLFEGLETCQKVVEADNPAQFNLGTAGFDEFIALWIGAGSVPGTGGGDSLYAMTEEAHELFGGSSDESTTNAKIKSLYQEASTHLSVPGVCTKEHIESPRKLWSIAGQIISQMQVPLIRHLIASILDQDQEMTELFATAVVPQAAQCRPSVYKRLKDYLLTDSVRFDKSPVILRDLQDVYSCFGLTCDDIGTIADTKGADIPECIGADERAPMAQYNPTSSVHSISRIDLDILQLRILTSLGAFDYAKLWYSYGRNSPVERDNENDPFQYYSLSDLAVATSRRNADPIYSEFVRYHNNNNYADRIIRDTLEGSGKWGSKSVAQRSAVITETSAFMVLYLHLIAQMNDAVKQCRGVDSEGEYDLTHPWDEVAALLIGSLEGTEEGGSADFEDGQLIWALGSRRGFQFQTLNKKGYANINSQLEDLLYAGKGEIDALECDVFEKTADQIKSLTLVPLMQSVVRYAIQNEENSSNMDSEDLALGETYALAILPIMQATDPSAAAIIEENMIFQAGIPPTRDGAQEVADAIGNFAVASGLRCSLLGSTPQAKPCRIHGGSSASGLRPGLFAMASIAASILFLLW